MTNEQMNKLNNYFDELDHNITKALNKREECNDCDGAKKLEAQLKMLIDIRSKIAEISKE